MRERRIRPLVLLAYSIGSVFLVLVVLSVAIRIQDWMFRSRAERLFRDVQSIEPLHTSFEQMDSIFGRWNDSASYRSPCSKKDCELDVGIVEPIKRHSSKPFMGLLKLYRFLGGHPAIVRVYIKVTDGVVSSKRYSLAIEAPQVTDAEGRSPIYYVLGNISTENPLVRPGPKRHPEYEIGSKPCLDCLEIHVSFTPFADPADVRRLSRINFSCLTRQHPCRTRSEIMPSAASESLKEDQLRAAPS